MAVLSAILYGPSEEKALTEQEAMEAAAAEAGVTLPTQGGSDLMDDYSGDVTVTEKGSPMLRAVQKSLQHADAVMLKQNEIHRELIDAAGKE